MAEDGAPLEITIDGSGLTGTAIDRAARDLGTFSRQGLDPSGHIVGIPPRYYTDMDDYTGQPVDDPELTAWLEAQLSEDAPPDARWTNTPREMIREGSTPRFLSTAPDVAHTPMGGAMVPTPYNITGTPTSPQNFAGTVRATDQRLMLLRSREMVTTGAEPGTGLGLASGTINGPVDPLDHSTNVRAEGSHIIRDGDQVWMNNHNTIGVAEMVGSDAIHLGTIDLNGEDEVEGAETEEPGFWGSLWQGAQDLYADTAEAIAEFDRENGRILTRAVGVVQALGGAAEALMGMGMAGIGVLATPTGVGTVPGVGAMVLGGALTINGADNFITGLRTAWSGEFQHNLMSEAVGGVAEMAGASPDTVETIKNYSDLASGALSIGGGIAGGIRMAGREGLEAGAREAAETGAREASEAAGRQIDEVAEGTAAQTGRVTRQSVVRRGANEKTTVYDPETGRPISESGTITEDFGATARGDNATEIGRLGQEGDHGGHLGAHRFFGDTPDQGIVPQAGNLNTGAWKKMENEWADWVNNGYRVDYDVDVFPPGAVRPDSFDVQYVVTNPTTGQSVYRNTVEFENAAGQIFDRIYPRDMPGL